MNMRIWRLCLVVLFLLTGPVAFGQETAVPFRLPNLAESLKKFDLIQVDVGKRLLQAAQATQDKAKDIPLLPTSADAVPTPVSADEKVGLLNQIGQFVGYVTSEEGKFTHWAIACIAGAIIFSVLGGIAGLRNKANIAAALGFLVTAIISFSNAYPLNALSDFYRDLEGQAKELQVDCELNRDFTADSYNSAANQLKLLYLYEGTKRPGFAHYEVPVQELATDLQTVKTAAAALEQDRSFGLEALVKPPMAGVEAYGKKPKG